MCPFHIDGSTIETQDHEGGLPAGRLICCSGDEVPHESVSIMRAGHDSVSGGGPIDARYGQIMLQRGGKQEH